MDIKWPGIKKIRAKLSAAKKQHNVMNLPVRLLMKRDGTWRVDAGEDVHIVLGEVFIASVTLAKSDDCEHAAETLLERVKAQYIKEMGNGQSA